MTMLLWLTLLLQLAFAGFPLCLGAVALWRRLEART